MLQLADDSFEYLVWVSSLTVIECTEHLEDLIYLLFNGTISIWFGKFN